MLTEGATFSSTDVTTDVHLGRWLGEGEIWGTETNLCLVAKHLLSKEEEHLLQVGERNIFVDIKSFNLVEEAVCTIADSFVSIYATRAKDADRRFRSCLHAAYLYATSVSAKDDVLGYILGILLNEEGVLHVACRMVSGKVQFGEHM